MFASCSRTAPRGIYHAAPRSSWRKTSVSFYDANMDYTLFALGLGFLLGLKHATEADHLVAVTTIVSEQRSVARSALVGAMWGVGHTAALLAAGVVVILLEVTIPERVAAALEFCVALMIVFLGSRVLFLALRRRRRVHVHAHTHGGRTHT